MNCFNFSICAFERVQIHWDGEHDRRVLFGRDRRQSLQVAQLERSWRRGYCVGSLFQVLWGIHFTLGGNDLNRKLKFLSSRLEVQLYAGMRPSPYWCRNKTLSERPILPSREKLWIAFKASFRRLMKYLTYEISYEISNWEFTVINII